MAKNREGTQSASLIKEAKINLLAKHGVCTSCFGYGTRAYVTGKYRDICTCQRCDGSGRAP